MTDGIQTKHSRYWKDVRNQLGLGESAGLEDMEVEAMRQMQEAGFEVLANRTPAGTFRVTVRKRNAGGKAHEPRFLYNEHTTSTSSYPVIRAWQKWREHRLQEGGVA